ncbi:hypothetical protein GCM10007913_43030 [Devosia yakushimensis]|uniref:DUF1471 domain-containing protein n=1 Tax=Devosia yakushimensis TaxID=470028 RepID=A0ABQ5UMH0_9HYPH|nr:hypothetical protein [Devosia yakushimensis]GLQ12370.1 hypothetical protein GCM10007913_43030 [Devosia yakushimensis]
MKMFKIIAISTVLIAGAGAASASPFNANGGYTALNAIGTAQFANVQKVNAGEASSLKFDTDTAALQSRLSNNAQLTRAIEAQGYSVSDIVGIDGTSANLTLYAL